MDTSLQKQTKSPFNVKYLHILILLSSNKIPSTLPQRIRHLFEEEDEQLLQSNFANIVRLLEEEINQKLLVFLIFKLIEFKHIHVKPTIGDAGRA